MAQTKEGAIKAVKCIKEKYGDDYFVNVGRLGGLTPKSTPSGFAANKERAVEAGRIGGRKSRRTFSSEQRLEHSERMIWWHRKQKGIL